VSLAICVAGLTSLLASPISWSHHYVWIVPLTVVLRSAHDLPRRCAGSACSMRPGCGWPRSRRCPAVTALNWLYTPVSSWWTTSASRWGSHSSLLCGVFAWRSRGGSLRLSVTVVG
jgi:hypothetical protein